MSQTTIGRHPAPSFHPIEAAFVTLGRVRRHLAAWRARRQSRAQLLTLGDHELQDIGISRAQALFETDKPFWRG
jgi:uncharacterized protein YjiS (DUF1127 family)